MTTIPQDTGGATWVVRRTDPGTEELVRSDAVDDTPQLSFGDLLDALNPLHHLPIIGTLYRELTGDTLGEAARMTGGVLYGGPFGLIAALANTVVERETGRDIGSSAMAWFDGGSGADGPSDTHMAATVDPADLAPVTIAAAHASPAGQAAMPPAGMSQMPTSNNPAGTVAFEGRAADRLDAFIRNASAVRRDTPSIPSLPGAIDTTRVQAAALKPPGTTARSKDNEREETEAQTVALVGGDGGTLNDWMLRALDKYDQMRNQETS
jgi:hypothetical protein